MKERENDRTMKIQMQLESKRNLLLLIPCTYDYHGHLEEDVDAHKSDARISGQLIQDEVHGEITKLLKRSEAPK